MHSIAPLEFDDCARQIATTTPTKKTHKNIAQLQATARTKCVKRTQLEWNNTNQITFRRAYKMAEPGEDISDSDTLLRCAALQDNRRPRRPAAQCSRTRQRRWRTTSHLVDGIAGHCNMMCWQMVVVWCTLSWCLLGVGASYSEAEDLINDLDRPSK